jgi:hypothetical protein
VVEISDSDAQKDLKEAGIPLPLWESARNDPRDVQLENRYDFY